MTPREEEPYPGPTAQPAPARQPMSRRAKWIGAVIGVLLLVGLGALTWFLTSRPLAVPAIFGGSTSGPAGAGGPGAGGSGSGGPGAGGGGGRGGSTVGVATAEKASLPVTLEALGTVTPLSVVKVRPQVPGTLEKLLFTEGQMVRKGDLMALIDPRPYELALQQARGQSQRDAAQLESAKVTLQRFRTLLGQDSIARQEVDSQAALVKQLEGSAMVNQAAVGTAQLNLAYARVTAPISGRVGLRTVDVGNAVSPNDVNGLAVITQVTPIDVVFAVPQDRISDVLKTTGAAKQVTAFDRARTGVLATGTFASLDNQVDTTTGTVKAKARFDNADAALFANQFVNVQLQIKSIDNAVVVPVTALRLGGQGDYVYVLNPAERTVELRPVIRGQASGEKIVIASGLKAGEQVITEGADRLKDGSRVTLAGDAPRGGARRPDANAPSSASKAASDPGAAGVAGAAGLASPDKASPDKSATEKPASNNSAAAKGAAPSDANPAAAAPSSNATAINAAPPVAAALAAKSIALPTPEQRQRMLEQVKDDPVAIERRKRFFENLDKGEPEALDRWKAIVQRRQAGGQGGGPQQ